VLVTLTTTILALIAGAVVGVLEWRRIARKRPHVTLEDALQHARHLLWAIPIVIVLLAIQMVVVFLPDVAWSVPEWLEIHQTAVVFGSLAFVSALLLALTVHGAFATRDRRRIPLGVAMLLVVGVLLGVECDFLWPIASQLGDRTNGDAVLQSSGASCVAASAANLLRHRGIPVSEREVAAVLGTTRYGTSPSQLVRGLERFGVSCRRVRDRRVPAAPAILFLPPKGGVAAHAVLLTGRSGEDFSVIDPLSGRLVLTRSEVEARWHGLAVVCGPE
jgi:hypothetical protein